MPRTKVKNPIRRPVLEGKDLQLSSNSPIIRFTVREGEMLGFSGMIDSGRTEITEDRQKPGHALGLSVLANTTDVGRGNVIPGAFVNVRKQPPLIERVLQELQVKTPSG